MSLEFIGVGAILTALYAWIVGIEHIIIKHRWVFVCFFLLPFSVAFEFLLFVRHVFLWKLRNSLHLHKKRVEHVQEILREIYQKREASLLCTARPGWQAMTLRNNDYKRSHRKIDVNWKNILNVSYGAQVVKVESGVTMGQISAVLIPQGWTLPVLPELDDLTVGGMVMGCGIETSSHKYGLFQNTIVSFDLVLPCGDVVHCSKEENVDLFYAIPWSHGTLGFLVAAELKIIPAKKYVKLKYIPAHSQHEMVQTFIEESTSKNASDFVECLAFSKDRGVVMTGDMTDVSEPGKINCLGYFWKPWFFKHVETFLSQDVKASYEYIPLRHYFHRHTRSLFWELQDIIPFGNSVLWRYFLGWAMPPKISLLKLTQGKTLKRLYEEHHIVQDMLIPASKLADSLTFFDKEVKVYPLWLCPMNLFNVPGLVHSASEDGEMFVDIGAYGEPKVSNFVAKDTVRSLEGFVRKVKGFQMLYADSYMTREEFHQMFDHELYNRMREKLGSDRMFPQIYDKVCKLAAIHEDKQSINGKRK